MRGGAFFNDKEGRDDFRGKSPQYYQEKPLSFNTRKDFQSPSAPHVSYPSRNPSKKD